MAREYHVKGWEGAYLWMLWTPVGVAVIVEIHVPKHSLAIVN
jgi:hypothetical protein